MNEIVSIALTTALSLVVANVLCVLIKIATVKEAIERTIFQWVAIGIMCVSLINK